MRKLCLTKTECERIQGWEMIVDTIGYFPAMENTVLEDVEIKNTHRLGQRYQVSLLFDLSCGGKRSVKGGKNKIRMTFYGVREVHMHSYLMDWRFCKEIKFVNTTDIINVKRDDLPSTTPVLSRPFRGFVIGDGRDFYLEFDDECCTVDAYFEE